jgi:hypothetical protein
MIQPRRVSSEERGWIMSWFTRNDDDEQEAKLVIGEKDVWEAQFLANLFASHERHGPFKRVFGRFVPVRKKLAAIGSKWQGVQTFRLYRFKKGAWSDFVLDVIVGADRALSPVRDAQEAARVAKVELKRDVILREAEAQRTVHEEQMSEQKHVAHTRRKQRELAADRDSLGLEKEKRQLENEIARQIAVEADEFESYVPGQDRDPDGLMVKTKRERTHGGLSSGATSSAMPNPELMALMQSVSQQALATQEIARQQTAFMQEMAKSMEALAKARTGFAAEEARAPAQAANGNTASAGMTLGGVTDFAAYSNREPSLDAGRFREAKPSNEAPVVIPLHADRTEPRLGGDMNDRGFDRLADRLDASHGDNGHTSEAMFSGNAALAVAPGLRPVAPARPHAGQQQWFRSPRRAASGLAARRQRFRQSPRPADRADGPGRHQCFRRHGARDGLAR